MYSSWSFFFIYINFILWRCASSDAFQFTVVLVKEMSACIFGSAIVACSFTLICFGYTNSNVMVFLFFCFNINKIVSVFIGLLSGLDSKVPPDLNRFLIGAYLCVCVSVYSAEEKRECPKSRHLTRRTVIFELSKLEKNIQRNERSQIIVIFIKFHSGKVEIFHVIMK